MLQRPNYEEIAQELLKKLKRGEDIIVDSLEVLDEMLLYPEMWPPDVRFKKTTLLKKGDDWSIGLKTVLDSRKLGLNVL